ncbi:MAG TPA: CHASE3 domain-containing protein [Cyclobacteriaceae bacterium]
MRKNIRIKILLITSIALTIISAGITYYNVLEKKESTNLVIHTYEVIQSSRRLLTLVQDLETGQRGYLLTTDSSFLDPYHAALIDLDADIKYLKKIISSNARQTGLFDHKLLPIVERKKANLELSFDIMKKYGRDSASQFVARGIGKQLMDSTRYYVNDLIRHEEQQLVERSKNLEQVYFFSDVVHFSSFTLIGLTSVLALFTIRDKERVNNRLMQNLRELNRNLEQKVKERTQQLQEEKNHSVQLNEELQENLEEIRSLHDALLEANKKLLNLNEEKDHFLGVTTHDLKAPLVGINSLLQLLRLDGQNLTEKQKEYVLLMEDTCQTMQRLITDLLDVKRIEQGATPVNKKNISLSALLHSLRAQYATWLENKNIQFQIENDFEADVLSTDPDILHRILDNFISNAIKFSARDKKVIVQIYQKNSELMIHITDEGPGITEGDLNLLFGKFRKLTAKPTAGESSSGLGLSIVKELVHILDGNIKVKSKEGEGTTFTIILPLG